MHDHAKSIIAADIQTRTIMWILAIFYFITKYMRMKTKLVTGIRIPFFKSILNPHIKPSRTFLLESSRGFIHN